MHAFPSVQSDLVVHSFFVPGSDAGGVQTPDLQTSPFGQGASSEHVTEQPFDVQTDPGGQLTLPVQGVFVGAAMTEQPYPSHC